MTPASNERHRPDRGACRGSPAVEPGSRPTPLVCGGRPEVLAEYTQVVTDLRRFASPLLMEDALEVALRWWRARECRQVAADGKAVAIFEGWMAEHQRGRWRFDEGNANALR